MTDQAAYWTDQTLSWAAVGLMAYCERMSITRIEETDLPGFIRGAYHFHPNDKGDLDIAVDQLISNGYLQYDGDATLMVYRDA